MTIKSILALADGGEGGETTLEAAVECARQFGAQLDLLHVKVEPESMVPIVGEGMSGVMVEQMMEAMQKTVEARAARARAACQKLEATAGVPIAWREAVGREPETLAAAGRCTDLIVIGRPDGEREAPLAATLDAALFDSGRPVLIVPPGARPRIGRRILLAWNGSAQAARAVAGALPVLAAAASVTVVTVGDADRASPRPMLLAYLARHGVEAATAAAEDGGRSKAEIILGEAARLDADMLVAGAYGQSRLREMILGGTTRELLAKSGLPMLMAH